MKTLSSLFTVALISASLTACAMPQDDPTAPGDGDPTASSGAGEFEAALPTADDLTADMPQKTGTMHGALSSDGVDDEEDQPKADEYWWYTAKTIAGLNYGLGHILGPIRHVIETYEPAVVGKKKAVWYGSHPLDPQDHLLVVEKKATHYKYIVMARLKTNEDAKWRVRVVGTYSKDFVGGQGSVWVNLNTDLSPKTQGKVLALFSNQAGKKTITAYYFNFSADNTTEPPASTVIHYVREPDFSGALVQAIKGYDINPENGNDTLENALLITRWTDEGDGRGDLIAAGGDVAAQGFEAAARTQCWSGTTFQTVFEALTVKAPGAEPQVVETEGVFELCAFPDQGDPALPSLGEEPSEPNELPSEATNY